MQKKLCLALIGLAVLMFNTANVFASEEQNFSDRGIYLVGQAGLGSTNLGIANATSILLIFNDVLGRNLSHNTGFAGRIGIGSQLNRYFSLESGFSVYPTAIRNGRSIGSSKISNIYSADFMAIFRLPMGNHFFMGSGAGISVMHFTYAAMNSSSGHFKWQPGSAFFVAPKVEIRIGAKINQKTAVFLSASHLLSVNGIDLSKRNFQPGLSMLTLGLNCSL